MFDIAGTVELGTICPGTGTWNRLQDGNMGLCRHPVCTAIAPGSSLKIKRRLNHLATPIRSSGSMAPAAAFFASLGLFAFN